PCGRSCRPRGRRPGNTPDSRKAHPSLRYPPPRSAHFVLVLVQIRGKPRERLGWGWFWGWRRRLWWFWWRFLRWGWRRRRLVTDPHTEEHSGSEKHESRARPDKPGHQIEKCRGRQPAVRNTVRFRGYGRVPSEAFRLECPLRHAESGPGRLEQVARCFRVVGQEGTPRAAILHTQRATRFRRCFCHRTAGHQSGSPDSLRRRCSGLAVRSDGSSPPARGKGVAEQYLALAAALPDASRRLPKDPGADELIHFNLRRAVPACLDCSGGGTTANQEGCSGSPRIRARV